MTLLNLEGVGWFEVGLDGGGGLGWMVDEFVDLINSFGTYGREDTGRKMFGGS